MPAESYMVPLKRAYEKPRTRRSNVAVKEIFDFLYKHTRKRKEDIILSKEVNEFVWKRGIQKPPRKIPISIREQKGKIYVFLKDSKEIDSFFNKAKEIKEKKSLKEKVMEMKDSMQNPKASKKEDDKDAEVIIPGRKEEVATKPKELVKSVTKEEIKIDDTKVKPENTENKTEIKTDVVKEDTKEKIVDKN
jgi:large subunit ribosomal protein L31e